MSRAVFLGTHTPKLDDKGRLFLPARFREQLSEGVVMTKGQDRCLFVFKTADFRTQYAPLGDGPITAKPVRDYSRVLFASASAEVPDRQGRITVPASLRSYAGLTKDCVVIGANTRLEIWDAGAWATYEAEQEEAFAAQSEGVPDGLI